MGVGQTREGASISPRLYDSYDEYLATKAELERHLHLPARIVGESPGDHLRRGAPEWTEAPDELPLGEEGGTAWTPDNFWLREERLETEEPIEV